MAASPVLVLAALLLAAEVAAVEKVADVGATNPDETTIGLERLGVLDWDLEEVLLPAPDEATAGPEDEAATADEGATPEDEATLFLEDEAATAPEDEATAFLEDEAATAPEDEATTAPEDEAATAPEDEAATTDEGATAPEDDAIAPEDEATTTDEGATEEGATDDAFTEREAEIDPDDPMTVWKKAPAYPGISE